MRDYIGWTELALVAEIKKNKHDDRLYEELLRRYHKSIFHKTGNPGWRFTHEDREDVVINIQMAVCKAIPGFRGRNKKDRPCKLSTFIMNITIKQCIKMSKKIKREREKVEGLRQENRSLTEEPAYAKLLQEESEKEAGEQILAKLKKDDQLILHLHYVEEIPYEEIAEILSSRPATVRKRAERAKKRIEKALER